MQTKNDLKMQVLLFHFNGQLIKTQKTMLIGVKAVIWLCNWFSKKLRDVIATEKDVKIKLNL